MTYKKASVEAEEEGYRVVERKSAAAARENPRRFALFARAQV